MVALLRTVRPGAWIPVLVLGLFTATGVQAQETPASSSRRVMMNNPPPPPGGSGQQARPAAAPADVVYSAGKPFVRGYVMIEIPYEAGWKLMSIPVETVQPLPVDEAFPEAVAVFTYRNGTYQIPDDVVPGVGYWVLHTQAGRLSFEGEALTELTLSLKPGWNLVGSPAFSMDLADAEQEPENNLTGILALRDGDYVEAITLEPGRGYWVLANTTGTLALFPPLIADNVVVLDAATTTVVNDRAEQAMGRYVIEFDGTPPDIEVGDIVVGVEDGGFLRLVTGVTAGKGAAPGNKPILILETLQAALAQVLERAAFGRCFPFEKRYDFGNKTLFNEGGLTLKIPTGSIDGSLSFCVDAQFSFFRLNFFRATVRGSLGAEVDFALEAMAQFNKDCDERTLATFTRPFVFQVGPVPVVGIIALDFVTTCSVSLNASLTANYGFTASGFVEIGGQYDSGGWQEIFERQFNSETRPAMVNVGIQANARASVQPRVSVFFYGVAGATLTPDPYLDLSVNAATGGGAQVDWDAALVAGLDGSLAFMIKIFQLELADYTLGPINGPMFPIWNAPDSLDKISGDGQVAGPGQALPEPVVVKVMDSIGNPLLAVPVHFTVTGGGGSVDQASVVTIADGTARTRWTLGPAASGDVLTASIRNADGNTLKEVTFTANEGVPVITNARSEPEAINQCQVGGRTGSIYAHHIDFRDSNGDVAEGAVVHVTWAFAPFGSSGSYSSDALTFTGGGSEGTITHRSCISWGSQDMLTRSVSITDAGGLTSNTWSYQIERQAGADKTSDPSSEDGLVGALDETAIRVEPSISSKQ